MIADPLDAELERKQGVRAEWHVPLINGRVLRSGRVVALALLLLATGSCNGEDDTITVVGSVEFIEVEGGCWSILDVDQTRYEPINLPGEFKKDGLAVRAVVLPREDLGSVCQIGEIVEIVTIERR